MSDLIVKTCRVDSVSKHTNADTLDICIIGGWQVVARMGEFKEGDIVVYFPPDTVLPKEWTDKFGVTKYCQERDQGMRIRQAKLRGAPSFGLAVPAPEGYSEVGVDMSEVYGAKKYEPPLLGKAGDILGGAHGSFAKFTDIQNLRHYPDIFHDGEEVICTEKIHGTQVRLAAVFDEHQCPDNPPVYSDNLGHLTIYAGSKEWPRKMPQDEQALKANFYWLPWTFQSVRDMLMEIWRGHRVVELFGETYGRVQSLRYGINGISFAAFGLAIDGSYVDYDERTSLLDKFGVPHVPLLYRGPYSLAKIKEVSEGNTIIVEGEPNIREGTVVEPVHNRHDHRVGRVILKYVSDTYLFGKDHEKDTTDA